MKKGFTLVELMVVIGILGMLVGILAVVVVPKLQSAKEDLDVIQVKDIMADISSIETNTSRKKKLASKSMKELAGYRFFSAALHKKILAAETLGKLVSLTSDAGEKADTTFFDEKDNELEPVNCSWASPKAKDLRSALSASGKKRAVVLCFNADNWHNASAGVLLQMSDGSVAEYFDYDLFEEKFPGVIDVSEWEAGDTIIGEKKPFHRVFNGDE